MYTRNDTVLIILVRKLFFQQTSTHSSQVVDLQLDSSSSSSSDEERIRVNFNISMLDLSCEWAVIDVVSALGTDQNVSQYITKWPMDGQGVRQLRIHANTKQTPDVIALKDETVKDSIEDLHLNGEDAISLNAKTLQFAKDENDYLFVDFYAVRTTDSVGFGVWGVDLLLSHLQVV